MNVFDRTWRWVREQLPFLLVVAGLAVGFCYLLAEPQHPVRGTLAIAAVALAAAVLRLVLPDATAGMLAVRNRWFDAASLAVFGGLILASDIRLQH